MAVVNETIGTTGRDRSTITLWESNDGGGDGLGNDDCTGSCYDDTAFDESVTINFLANSIVLTVAAGERHDGTAGTGARVVYTSDGGIDIPASSITGVVTLEWLEVDMNGNRPTKGPTANAIIGNNEVSITLTIQRMLLHGPDDGATTSSQKGIDDLRVDTRIHDNLLYGFTVDASGTSRYIYGIEVRNANGGTIQNNTVHSLVMTNGGSGTVLGIKTNDDTDATVKNNVVTDVTGGSTKSACYDLDAPVNAVMSHNLASDTTASGTGSLDSKSSADQFVSISPVNLHLKAGADAIDAGTDLGTSPSGVEIDIDGWNRDSDTPSRDPWDMGSHEFESIVGGTILPQMLHQGLYGGITQ